MALSKKYKAFIKNNYKTMDVEDIAQQINVGVKIIQRFIKTLTETKDKKDE